ncbi:hypothetical protein FACS1894211_01850 [Clostridia bacterium]|nr:hypothetical protein FACS1894211_01850 [Clostridia bacterium]
MSSEEVKQKIVLAAIECMEMYGRANVTIRKIAKRANVNSAAISYYFGGRENILDMVMRQTLSNAFNISEFIPYETNDIKAYLKAVFVHLIQGAGRWPNISKAHFYDIYTNADYHSPVTDALNGFLKELYLKVGHKTALSEEVLKRRIFILMSQVIYFVISPKLLQDFSPVTDAEEFVNDLVDTVFFEGKV